jgi:hypothetical protein
MFDKYEDDDFVDLQTDTDLHQAQSDPYRRMSANLYKTKRPGEYYHIHGSLDASTTLKMIGLEPFRSDLIDHDAIVNVIEPAIQNFTIEELEVLNIQTVKQESQHLSTKISSKQTMQVVIQSLLYLQTNNAR